MNNPAPTQDPIADSYARYRKARLLRRIVELRDNHHDPYYLYASRKLAWEAQHPNATPYEHEAAMTIIAMELGI